MHLTHNPTTMKIIFIILLLITFGGCTQSQQEEGQSTETDERWFFWTVDWHPEKEQFVAGGSNDTFFKLFSSSDFQPIKTYPYKGTITQTKWHPTQNKLAVSVQDGKSQSMIFDLEKDQQVPLDSVSVEGARALGWNHTGELLAVGDYEGMFTIYDRAGNFLRRISTGQKSIIYLDWHPNENLIVAVGEKITLYDYESESLRHIEDREEAVLMLCVDWHPSGKFFVTGDYGDFEYHYPPLLQYWTYDGQRIQSIEESKAEYRNAKWSSDGMLLATTSDKMRLWNTEGELVAEDSTQHLLWGLDWQADGSKLLATDTQRKIICWDRNLERLIEQQF